MALLRATVRSPLLVALNILRAFALGKVLFYCVKKYPTEGFTRSKLFSKGRSPLEICFERVKPAQAGRVLFYAVKKYPTCLRRFNPLEI